MGLAEKYPVRYTVEDWRRWQGDWELVEGVPYAMASPRPLNQRVLTILAVYLELKLQRVCPDCKVYVELDWYISEDTVIRPDLMVLCGEVPERVERSPELVVEVVSPSSRQIDEGLKLELCQREKVRYFALVYPEEKVYRVFELVGDKYEEKTDKVFVFGDCRVEIDFREAFRGLG